MGSRCGALLGRVSLAGRRGALGGGRTLRGSLGRHVFSLSWFGVSDSPPPPHVAILTPMSDSYTSGLAQELAPDVLERFLRYVRIDTQSRRGRTSSPSTSGQLELARLLVAELADGAFEGVCGPIRPDWEP